jgi:hypothetical protein
MLSHLATSNNSKSPESSLSRQVVVWASLLVIHCLHLLRLDSNSGSRALPDDIQKQSQYGRMCCCLPPECVCFLCLTQSCELITFIMSEPHVSLQSDWMGSVNVTSGKKSNIERVREPFLGESKCLPPHPRFRCTAH